jgi:hypothetical protein
VYGIVNYFYVGGRMFSIQNSIKSAEATFTQVWRSPRWYSTVQYSERKQRNKENTSPHSSSLFRHFKITRSSKDSRHTQYTRPQRQNESACDGHLIRIEGQRIPGFCVVKEPMRTSIHYVDTVCTVHCTPLS